MAQPKAVLELILTRNALRKLNGPFGALLMERADVVGVVEQPDTVSVSLSFPTNRGIR